MEKITDILFAEVETANGKKLGRVFDIRSAVEPEHGCSHDERDASVLLYGTRGLLEMLGFKETELDGVSWDDIIKIEDRKIVIAEHDKKA